MASIKLIRSAGTALDAETAAMSILAQVTQEYD